MNNQIMDALGLLLTTVITGGIGVISTMVAVYFNNLKVKLQAETKKIENEETRKLINTALDRLNDLVVTNVQSANETLVKEIKEQSKDGYDKSDLLAIKNVVKNNILTQLSQDSKDLLALEINDLNSYIDNKIEVVLSEIKGQILGN